MSLKGSANITKHYTMLRGIERIITYVVMAVIVVFAVIFLVKQIGLTTDLKENMVQAKQAGLAVGDLGKITSLHQSSARVFFLSFFSFFLLLVGIIIIMRGIERAYDISEVKEKVRHHLKSTTPGIVMVVLASFLLVFSIYKSSNLEAAYSRKLVDFNNYKVAMEGFKGPENSVVHVDSSVMSRLKGKGNAVIKSTGKNGTAATKKQDKKDNKAKIAGKPATLPASAKQAVKPAPPVAQKPQPARTIAKTDNKNATKQASKPAAAPKAVVKKLVPSHPQPVAKNSKLPAAKIAAPATTKQVAATPPKAAKPVAVAKSKAPAQVAQKQAAKAEKPAISKKTQPVTVKSQPKANKATMVYTDKKQKRQPIAKKDDTKEDESIDAAPVTAADVEWARSFQRRVTIYGYNPTHSEKKRYRNVYHKTGGRSFDNDMHWAYSFLEKTRKGYEPKPGEMSHYEDIIERKVRSASRSESSSYQ